VTHPHLPHPQRRQPHPRLRRSTKGHAALHLWGNSHPAPRRRGSSGDMRQHGHGSAQLLLLRLHQQPPLLLEFTPIHTWESIILADPVHGCIFTRIEAILLGQAFPPNSVNDWALLQHEDVPSGEGECHTSNGTPSLELTGRAGPKEGHRTAPACPRGAAHAREGRCHPRHRHLSE
jgi:hypothetical protein